MKRTCFTCGKETTKPQLRDRYYCDEHFIAESVSAGLVWQGPCSVCMEMVVVYGERVRRIRKTGRANCGPACWRSYQRQKAGEAALRAVTRDRAVIVQRMKDRNPMFTPEVRERATTTLREMGHAPPVRGGNGRGPTVPQKMLADRLGLPMEVIVRTNKAPGSPTHYKVDIGDPSLKLAIEVDGASHGSTKTKAKDARKDLFLRGLGWTVLRFSNQAVMDGLEACALIVLSTISKLRTSTPTLPMAS